VTLDVLIRGGRVPDGTGNPTYPADVANAGDRIVDVDQLNGAVARRVIDAHHECGTLRLEDAIRKLTSMTR
jgi:N-acyl-D-aspartate/D-glutamate deacylase